MLRIDGLTYRIGGRAILDSASVTVPANCRTGLVGRNGAGKTTLLRLIAGEILPDAGTVDSGRGARIGTVAQEAPDGPDSLLATVLAADGERTQLLGEAETACEPLRIAEIHDRLADIGAHSAPARAAEILAGLGFESDQQERPCRELSGGWRMRVAIATVLFARPDVLLLDEPTNHLDYESTLWLETFLARYRGTVILVSHDRDLLDRTTERTIHLENGRLSAHGGNYTAFERALRERRALQLRTNANLMAQRRKMLAFTDRFRAKATKARQVQSRLKALDRMAPIVPVIETRPVGFDFPDADVLPPPLVALDGASAGYDGVAVLSGLDLRIDMDDRIAVLGPNGNGKSTLIKLLAGRLAPMSGRLTRPPKLRVGYFAQHQADELRAGESPYQHLAALEPRVPETRLRAHLGRFGFAQDKADVAAAELSGGEKARLLFALMSRAAPHIMLLDEPTNHLDIESREALAQALNAFAGAVILISHDPHLIGLTADRLWLVAEGTCRPFDGDLEEYGRLVLKRRREGRQEGRGQGRNGGAAPRRRDARRAAAETRAALAPLRRAAKEAESAVARLTAEKAAIEARLADPLLYNGASDALQDLLKTQVELHKRLADAENDWLAAHEAYELARG